MSRRMQDETTIREVMYPEIDWQTYNWLKDFSIETLTGDDKKRYDDFVMKYVRIGGFTMTELDKANYPVPSRYELVYWHYKDAESPYRAVFQAVYHSEYQGSINDLRSVIFDFDGSDYATSFNSTGAKPFAPLLYTNTFSITNYRTNVGTSGVNSFTINFAITQNKYNGAVKIKTNDFPQTATNELIQKLTNNFAFYPATGTIKLTDGTIAPVIGIKTGWRVDIVYSDGATDVIDLSAYFNSDQSVASDNANRYVNWTEASRAVNAF